MDGQEKKTYKRRKNYFIDRSFQTKFILKFCALVALGGLLTIAVLYVSALQSSTVSVVNSRVVVKTTADFLLPVLVQTVLIVMIVVSIATVAVTVFVSHKIAGPLYHVKMGMKTLESGDFTGDFRIRHLDQLQDLAVTFDGMIKKIRGELKLLKGGFVALQEAIDTLSKSETDQRNVPFVTELNSISTKLNKIINYFKT